jgi:regulator of sigma E protease
MLDLVTSFALGGLGFLFVISLVVFVHELGHFLAGRYFGVKVEVFSIGFGRELFGFTDRHGTRWKVAALPLGGYVKFWGDENAASAPNHEQLNQISPVDRSQSFHHKVWWQKAIVSAAGPLANFILAIAILAGLFMAYGSTAPAPIIGSVKQGYPADQAGLKPGDRIVSIDGASISSFNDLVKIVSVSDGHTLGFVIERDGQRQQVAVTPTMITKPDSFGSTIRDPGIGVSPVIPGQVENVIEGSPAAVAGIKAGDIIFSVNETPVSSFRDIASAVETAKGSALALKVARQQPEPKSGRGVEVLDLKLLPLPVKGSGSADQQVLDAAGFAVYAKGAPEPYVRVTYGPIEAISAGAAEVKFIVVKTIYFIGQLLTGSADYQQLSGPIGIASISGKVAVEYGLIPLINLAAVLSVSIGLLNLFPIPMLDGGHIMYYAIEAVRGRPLGERAQELGFRIGLGFVGCLLLFATWNDLTKLVSG